MAGDGRGRVAGVAAPPLEAAAGGDVGDDLKTHARNR